MYLYCDKQKIKFVYEKDHNKKKFLHSLKLHDFTQLMTTHTTAASLL